MGKKTPRENRPVQRNHAPKTFEMVCVGDPKQIGKVEEFLKEVNKTVRLDDGTFYRVFVATTEAVNNAIIHGNKSDRRKKVCVTCIVNSDSLTVRVTDEGKGFDPNKLPNPLDEQNLLKESGRGIFLIKSMTDGVQFDVSDQGTRVEMVINLRRLR